MTRTEKIALFTSIGIAVPHLECMTDAEYEAERDFQEEKHLRLRMEFPERKSVLDWRFV